MIICVEIHCKTSLSNNTTDLYLHYSITYSFSQYDSANPSLLRRGRDCAPVLSFKQFYSYFGGFIPTLRVKNFDNQTQQAIINQLSRNDHESVNNLCCYAAKRNGKHDGVQYHRTPFNSDKTKLLRSALFDKLGKNDNTISFYYREENPLDDIEIYTRFAQQYGIN